jgi:hypothetical protein
MWVAWAVVEGIFNCQGFHWHSRQFLLRCDCAPELLFSFVLDVQARVQCSRCRLRESVRMGSLISDFGSSQENSGVAANNLLHLFWPVVSASQSVSAGQFVCLNDSSRCQRRVTVCRACKASSEDLAALKIHDKGTSLPQYRFGGLLVTLEG